jgi:hypothetical protein
MNHVTLSPKELSQHVKKTRCCPYCDRRMAKSRVPDSPLTEWPSESPYVCFNDDRQYSVSGWEHSKTKGFPGSHRFMYDPTLDGSFHIPVLNRQALRESIVEEER